MALGFNGSTDYVACLASREVAGSITISAWINATFATNRKSVIFSNYPAAQNTGVLFEVGYGAGNGNTNLALITPNTGWAFGVSMGTTPLLTHLAVTVVATVGVTFYINGVFSSFVSDATSSVIASTSPCSLGRCDAYTTNYLLGYLADVCVWNRVLAAYEIAALADPSNTDLRIGGVPLIQSMRRYWPTGVTLATGNRRVLCAA
jgi:hypothetical protein